MPDPLLLPVHRFIRRVGWGLFLGGCARGLLLVAVLHGAVLLAVRPFEVAVTPSPWWALEALIPLLWGIVRLRRAGLGAAHGAAHLDRRLALGGLLVTAVEQGSSPAWDGDLRAGLSRAAECMPRVRWRPLVARAAPALALAIAVSLLPPVEVERRDRGQDPVKATELAALEKKLDLLADQGLIEPERAAALRDRADALRQRLDEDMEVQWSDLDSLEAQVAQGQVQGAANIEKALSELNGFGRNAATEAAEAAREALGRAVRGALDAGLLSGLPEALRGRLGIDGSDRFDPAGLPADLEALRALGDAMEQALGDALGDLGALGALDASQLADLQEVLEGYGECFGDGEGWPGRGGRNRGPGPATQDHSNRTDLQTAKAQRLPPGQVPSRQWMELGGGRTLPDVDPRRDAGSGGAGAVGPGAASWRRDVLPRHRELVRRFFTKTRDR